MLLTLTPVAAHYVSAGMLQLNMTLDAETREICTPATVIEAASYAGMAPAKQQQGPGSQQLRAALNAAYSVQEGMSTVTPAIAWALRGSEAPRAWCGTVPPHLPPTIRPLEHRHMQAY